MSTQQASAQPVAAWEYGRAFVLPEEILSVDLRGDQLVRAIRWVEAELPPEWRTVRLKISADDRGRAWFDLLLKQPDEEDLPATLPMPQPLAERVPARLAA